MSTEAADLRMVTTRGVENAPLPVKYEAARAALAECVSIDEAATWASKAAALASYARQADDKTLETMAVRIRARAIRRCGELLKEIPAKAHRPQKGGEPPPHHSERAQAVKDAGLSPDQAKDALRVAKVPAGEFEEAVESETPPTISELAERGTQKKAGALVDIEGRDPEEYNRALLFNGALKELATAAKEIAPEMVFRGSVPRHYERMRDNASFLLEWLNRLRELLETHR